MPRKTDILRVRMVAEGGGQVRAQVLGVDDSFNKLNKSSTGLAAGLRNISGLFTVLAAGAITSVAKSTLDYADSIDKAAQRAGIGTNALQELRFAGEQLGITQQQLDDGFRRFTRRIGIFVAEGGGPAKKTFERLGIAVRDASGEVRSSEAIFDDLVIALEGVESAAERSAIAAQVFGDDAGPQLRLLLDQGSEGLGRLRQEAQDLGVVLDESVIENSVAAKDNLAKLALVIKTQATVAVAGLTEALVNFFELTEKAQIKSLNNQLEELTDKAKGLTEELKRGVSGPRETAIIRDLREIGEGIGEVNAKLQDLQKTEDEGGKGEGTFGGLASDVADTSKELEKLLDRLNPLQARTKQYNRELQLLKESITDVDELREAVEKLNKEFADATGGPNELRDSIKKVAKEAKPATDEIARRFETAAESTQRSFGDTFTEIWRQGEFRFETLSDAIRDIFARLAGEITALLVFRPQILGGGLGGLGTLFGGSATAAPGGGLAAGGAGGLFAGGGLGTLSLAQSALLLGGLGGAGGILGGRALSGSFGIDNNAGGLLGGLLGAGAGGYGGLLLGSSPLAIGLGALVGGFGGNILGNIFGGGLGGNDKQRFGFATGTQGVPSPFGNLNVTSAQNVDANAILKSLISIDEGIAELLTPGQISRVQSGLAETGQFYSVAGFDNEIFDVVKTRMTRILDSLSGNQVASQVLNRIGRSPGNVNALVTETGRIIELINLLSDEAEPINEAEKALRLLSQAAEEVGISIEDAAAKLARDFNKPIAEQILAIEQPLQAALNAEQDRADLLMDNARALNADTAAVKKLNALRRSAIVEQAFGGANSSIGSFLQSLQVTGAGGLSVGAQAGNAEALFNSLLSSARTDPASRSQLAGILPGLLTLKREQLGSTPEFFQFSRFLQSTLTNLVDQTDTVATLDDVGQAITAGDNSIVEAITADTGAVTGAIDGLRGDIRLLLNSPGAA